ncbi:MAG: hypothetical protein WED00_01955 [Aquisalimonadaceae bacterium]
MTDAKTRHVCLTAWLALMIVINAMNVLVYSLGSEALQQALPDVPAWAFPVLIALSLFNLVCAIALFQWKKWGFWGVCVSSVVTLVVNLSLGFGIGAVFTGLVGVLMLYGVLHIGKENKGWPQLG